MPRPVVDPGDAEIEAALALLLDQIHRSADTSSAMPLFGSPAAGKRRIAVGGEDQDRAHWRTSDCRAARRRVYRRAKAWLEPCAAG